ncbi:MAG: hypothetical protein ACKVU0_08540 [Saprospiraceae bacterium]
MDGQKDYEFSSPLSLQDALQRLKKQSEGTTYGVLYGSVVGRQFFLHHNVGKFKKFSFDDPKLSGYILPEGNGCRVFVRIQVDPLGAISTYAVTIIALIIFVVLLNRSIDILKDGFPLLAFIVDFLRSNLIEFGLPSLFAFAGFLIWKRLGKSDTPDAILQLWHLMEGGAMVETEVEEEMSE